MVTITNPAEHPTIGSSFFEINQDTVSTKPRTPTSTVLT